MAIKKVIEIDVDQVKAQGGLDKFTENLKKSETGTKSLRNELRQLREQLADLPAGTEEYNVILQRAGEVGDRIADINQQIRNVGSDTRGIDAVVQGAQTLSGAFSVATSASALLGSENKDLQESMLKVESAIGLVVGVQSIANALQRESSLVIGATNLMTKIQIGLQTAYAAVVGTTTGALKALKLALISTGIGAIVIALGYLISKMNETKASTVDLTGVQEKLNNEMDRYNNLIKDNLDLIKNEEDVAVLRAKIAGQSEEQIFGLQKTYNKKKEQELKEDLERKKQIQLQYTNDLTKNLSKLDEDGKKKALESEKKAIDEVNKARDAYFNQTQASVVDNLNFELEVANKQREAQEKARAEANKRAEERRKELEEQRKKELEDYQNFLYTISKADDEQRLIQYENRKQEQEDVMTRLQNIADEQDKLNAADLEASKNLADAKKKISDAELEARREHTNQLESILEGFSNIAGKQTAVGKTLAIAAATINMYKGVSEVWGAKSMGNPAVDMAIKIASSALVLANGFKTIKNITAVKIPNVGGGGGGAVGSPQSSSTPPSFNIVGQNTNNQLAQSIAGRQGQPIEAFVVSGNVTNAQSLDRNRIVTATFN